MVKVSGDIKLTGLPLRDRLRICKITLERKFIFVWGGETNSLGTVEELSVHGRTLAVYLVQK